MPKYNVLINQTNKEVVMKKDTISGGTIQNIQYGALYNWYAAGKNGGSGTGSIAPLGWHLPTVQEFWDLSTFIDPIGTQTSNNVGGKLMEMGTTHWLSPNTFATNEYGFNAKGTGLRSDWDASFSSFKYKTHYWTNDESGGNAKATEIRYDTSTFYTSDPVGMSYLFGKTGGLTIRLIKDDSTNDGTVTDIDGNTYPTVKIGNQVWMAENLIVEYFNDGTPIPNVTGNTEWAALSTEGMCYYNNDINNAYTIIEKKRHLVYLSIIPTIPIDPSLIFEVDVNNESVTIELAQAYSSYRHGMVTLNYDFTIDWGDESTISHITSYNDAELTHSYSAGTYQVKMTGACRHLSFYGTTIAEKITKVLQWGTIEFIILGFDTCSNLTELPNGPVTCVGDLEGMSFYYCSSLLSIPTGMFDLCVYLSSIGGLFRGCSSILSIPLGLFDNNPLVQACSSTFSSCTSLQSIPAGLFNNLVLATSFGSCFSECSSLQTIPSGLFDNNINANNFELTFRNCTSLSGNAPTLWLTYPTASGFWCFNNCTGLTNYADIPSNWK